MVDFAVSEAKKMLQGAAREFLETEATRERRNEADASPEGFDLRLWRQMADLDWFRLPFAPPHGAGEGGLEEVSVLAEELGRVAMPSPFIPTIVAGLLLQESGRPELVELLAGITAGQTIVSFALLEADGRYTPDRWTMRAERSADGVRIFGRKSFVPYGHVSHLAITLARTAEGEPMLLIARAGTPGITSRTMETVGGDRLTDLTFDGVAVPEQDIIATGDAAVAMLALAWDRQVGLKCAEMLGGMEKVVEMTADHARTRVQFGKPIGTFQAVQQICADMQILAEGSRLVTLQAIARLADGRPASREVSVAKAFTGESYRKVVSSGAHVHGGIGFIKDFVLHHYFRSAKAGEILYGTPNEHLDRVAATLAS